MKNQKILQERQYNNALKTLENLRKIKTEIDLKLNSNPVCSNLNKDLRNINLEITITLNEIEHLESHLYEINLKNHQL